MSIFNIQKYVPAFSKAALCFLVWLVSSQVWAHGLEIRLFLDGSRLIGQVVYENGSPWFAESVSVENLSDPSADTQTVTTDSAGGFSIMAAVGNEYLIRASDDTGHVTETRVTLDGSSSESGTVSSEEQGGGIPFYVIASALLLLSIIPAKYLKQRSNNNA